MRDLVVAKLRAQVPGARIIHELPLRYSSNRIDIAAVAEAEIVSVEIKSSRDVADRLEAQLRGFAPISSRLIVALAPRWNEDLPPQRLPLPPRRGRPGGSAGFITVPQYTAAQEAIRRVRDDHPPHIEVWTVSAEAGTVETSWSPAWSQRSHVWPARLLNILHVAELEAIAFRHRLAPGGERHDKLVDACVRHLTTEQALRAACAMLRARAAFAAESDPPIPLPPEAYPPAGLPPPLRQPELRAEAAL